MGSGQGRELVTQAEYARRKGVTRQSIGELVERGVLTLIDGKIDPVVADIQLADSMDPARSKTLRAAPASSPGSAAKTQPAGAEQMRAYMDAKTEREQYAAQLVRLEYEERIGSLVKREDVERAAFTAGRTLRDQLMGISRRIGSSVRSAASDRDAERLIDTEIQAALKTFCVMAERGGFSAGADAESLGHSDDGGPHHATE